MLGPYSGCTGVGNCLALNVMREKVFDEIGEPIIAAPALADGVVIIGAEDGRVHAFGPAK